MTCAMTLDRSARTAKPGIWRGVALLCTVLSALLVLARPAQAADGCTVLLCLAAPNWREIPQCVPPIHELLRDLARGRAFPGCQMGGAGEGARHDYTSATGDCPPQYSHTVQGESTSYATCDYDGVISVSFGGAPWTRTWWRRSGDAVTEFSPTAKAQLGRWDSRFDDERAALLGTSPCNGC